MKAFKKANTKSYHHKEKIFFSFSFILCFYEMVDIH